MTSGPSMIESYIQFSSCDSPQKGNLAETNFTKRAGKGGVMNWTSAHIQCQLLQLDRGNNHLEHQLWKFLADSFLFMGVGTIASHSFYSHLLSMYMCVYAD